VHWAEFALGPVAQCAGAACGIGSAHARGARRGSAARRRRGSPAHRDGGVGASAHRRRRRRRARTRAVGRPTAAAGGAREAVGRRTARARQRRGDAWRGRGERARREEGAVGTTLSRCPDSGFKPRHRRGAWQPRGSGALPRGPGPARDG
jgi:hypothetical protein